MPNVFTIPASVPFAQALARGILSRVGGDPLQLSETTIYLPTRRAVRTLSEAFAREMGGAALLPEIKPLGDVDEDEMLFDDSADGFDLAPAIAPLRRRLLLATLIRKWDEKRDGTLSFAQAVGLGSSLSRLLDETGTQGVSLDRLDDLVEGHLAQHWKSVRDFLLILRDVWPDVLAGENAANPAEHRNTALLTLAKRLEKSPPKGMVVAAGSTGSIPATATLLSAIARLPNGLVVLPGLDRALDEDSWQRLDPGHAQYGMMHLLETFGVARGDVADWTESIDTNREAFLSEALRPAPTTDAWLARAEAKEPGFARGVDGVALLEAPQPADEATAIAIALREVLEKPGQTAALVTPDRGLARRVASEMGRWTVNVNDSAGRPLAQTPAGSFLCLLAEAAEAQFAPVPLLAVLKHPLAALGQEPIQFRFKVRALDRLCLRGPRPDPGLRGIADAIARALEDARQKQKDVVADVQGWFSGVAAALQPLADAFSPKEISLQDVLKTHIAVAEHLASDPDTKGAARLWRGSDGEAAAKLVAGLHEAAAGIPPVETSSYTPLFRTLVDEKSVRLPFGNHPRLSILGPLEARLQSFDLVVVGGLNEGTWPQAAPIDPWFSRPMRSKLGLEQPERQIGLAAHDFATLAAGQRVLLTRSLKVDGAPAIASRWLQRVQQLAAGVGAKLGDASQYANWAALLDEALKVRPEKAPEPRPPVEARPRSLSVTEIETWLRDPYAIYARRVLKLEKLEPLDEPVGARERGTIVHDSLEKFLRRFSDIPSEQAERELVVIADEMFAEARIPQATLAVWRPRFISAARWFIGLERQRQAEIVRSHAEVNGRLTISGPAGDFVLRGRADRIDELRSGGAVIVDYKTGKPPSGKQVKEHLSPQLSLEGAMLAEGTFEGVGALVADELLYIQFSGGRIPGRAVPIDNGAALALEAFERLKKRVEEYDAQSMPYLSRLIPFRADIEGDYDHLARVREWSLSGYLEEEET